MFIISNLFEMSIGKDYNKFMMNNNYITEIFKVLQEPIRIRIIEMLQFDQERREFLPNTDEAKAGFCPMDILRILHEEDTDISNTKLSYHLKELRKNNLIHLVKEGKRNFYLFNKDGLEIVVNWINSIIDE
ncbi:ArsR/SmtB family transcription factor [Robertmurraya sp. Marseille-Q9965]